jgi:hypothetical protein
MAPPVKDFGELLKDVPPGAWVAISRDEQRVVAYAAEMRDALSKAKELGKSTRSSSGCPNRLFPLSCSALYQFPYLTFDPPNAPNRVYRPFL